MVNLDDFCEIMSSNAKNYLKSMISMINTRNGVCMQKRANMEQLFDKFATKHSF